MFASEAAPSGYAPVQLRYGPYSASKLLVARCPARFQGKYVLKDRIVSDSLASARGSVIHLVLEKITTAWVAGEIPTSQEINGWIEQGVGRWPAAYESIKLIKDACTAYLANPPKQIIRETAKAEMKVAIKLFEEELFVDDVTPGEAVVFTQADVEGQYNPDATFAGTIDLLWIDEQLKIVTILDHKSTPSASKNSDFDFQMGCYAFLASLLYPGYRVQTQIHYAHPDLDFYGPADIWTEDELEDVWQEIRMRMRAIESFVEYPAVPGSSCTYCHMSQQCPEFQAVAAQNARGDINLNVHTVQDLQRLAGQVTVLGKLYDQINGALKDGIESICPTNGVAVDGVWYGFRVSESKVDWEATERKFKDSVAKASQDPNQPGAQSLIETRDLTGLLARHGVTPDAFKEWKGDKMKALFKMAKPELNAALKDHLVFDKKTRFGGYKI
jgi:hypothetical protein